MGKKPATCRRPKCRFAEAWSKKKYLYNNSGRFLNQQIKN